MITLVTSNAEKLKELRTIMSGVELEMRSIDTPEIQSMDLEEIVRAKARSAFEAVGGPVIVEDVSFEVAAVGGMPGPFIKWWNKAAGYESLLVLCRHTDDWRATARCGSAYFDGTRLEYAEAAVHGRLTEKSGGEGFGFDFYFIPDGYDQTFAELGNEIKNRISHRGRSLRTLREKL